MASKLTWVALGVGAYLAFTLARFPADAAYRWFLADTIALAGIEGTVWSGSAELGAAGGLALRDVRWQVDSWPLLIGRVAGRFQAGLADGFVSSRFSASPSAVVLEEVQLSTSLAALADVVPVAGTAGLVSATLDELRLEDGWPVRAVGTVRVAQLETAPFLPTGRASKMIALGDYEAVFKETAEPGVLAADIRDTGGPLELMATLTLDRSRAYTLEGAVRPRTDAAPELVQALEIMTGEPDAAGRRALGLTGSL
ncbi:MAG TPA: type II secretion system protein N [Gammaproteobacteria bacterium]